MVHHFRTVALPFIVRHPSWFSPECCHRAALAVYSGMMTSVMRAVSVAVAVTVGLVIGLEKLRCQSFVVNGDQVRRDGVGT
jgi:hypothetical protein